MKFDLPKTRYLQYCIECGIYTRNLMAIEGFDTTHIGHNFHTEMLEEVINRLIERITALEKKENEK